MRQHRLSSWTNTLINIRVGRWSRRRQVAVSTSKAKVSSGRVLLWLLLNLIFTVSGLLFLFLQTRCSQPVIVDASMAALPLDTSDVLHMRNRALCNFSRLVKD